MSLDTVELVMQVEETFNVSIADHEAEGIVHVGDFSRVIRDKVQFHADQKCASEIVYQKIEKGLEGIGVEKDAIRPDCTIIDLLKTGNIQHKWNELEKKTGLKLPKLVLLDKNRELKREISLFGITIKKRVRPITENTIGQLVDWTISMNHEELIDSNSLTNQYEIDRVVCGIIQQYHGIPVNEIELHHAITSDLGLD